MCEGAAAATGALELAIDLDVLAVIVENNISKSAVTKTSRETHPRQPLDTAPPFRFSPPTHSTSAAYTAFHMEDPLCPSK